jgi:hypothetical protein
VAKKIAGFNAGRPTRAEIEDQADDESGSYPGGEGLETGRDGSPFVARKRRRWRAHLHGYSCGTCHLTAHDRAARAGHNGFPDKQEFRADGIDQELDDLRELAADQADQITELRAALASVQGQCKTFAAVLSALVTPAQTNRRGVNSDPQQQQQFRGEATRNTRP